MLEIYESAYRFEHQRKDTLNSRVGLPIAALTMLVAAQLYIVDKLQWGIADCLVIACSSVVGLSFVAIGYAFYALVGDVPLIVKIGVSLQGSYATTIS